MKLLEVHTDYIRRANREKTKITEDNYPKLWILTPTASSKILENIGAKTDADNWGEGVYLLAPLLRTALVVIPSVINVCYTFLSRGVGRDVICNVRTEK